MRCRNENRSASNKKQPLFLLLLAISCPGCATSKAGKSHAATHSRLIPWTTPAGDSSGEDSKVVGFRPPAKLVGHPAPVVDSPLQNPTLRMKATESGGIAVSAVPHAVTLAQQPVIESQADLELSGQPVEYFVSVALATHPELGAARSRVAAATNVIAQSRALPDPRFNNTFWPIQDQALQTAGGRVGHQFQLSQGVPWPEKRRAKAAIASQEVHMAQADVLRIKTEVTESVRLAYYEVWFATRAMDIVEQTTDLVDDLTEVAAARYRTGGTQQDVLRSQLEADRLADKSVGLRQQKAQAQADLAALLQQPATLVPETTETLQLASAPQQLDNLLALAEQCSPELKSLAWEIQRDRQKQRLAGLEEYPDFQVGVNYAIIDDDTNTISPVADGHDNISFAFGVTLPIWRDKIAAGNAEAAHRRNSSAQRLNAQRSEVQRKLRRLVAQADALVEQRSIYQQRIIPRSEATLKLAIADYRGKRTDFYALIETYRELLMFETQLARIEATLAGAIARIERTVGCQL